MEEHVSSWIVVGWDFDTAGPALEWAARQARLANAGLVLVHVAVPHVMGTVETLPPAPTAEDLGRLAESMRRSAAELGVPVEVELIAGTSASDALLEVARERGAELICVGHGRSLLARMLVGSVANQLVRKSPIPVVVVRSGT
jgi:nucleotide-binding universal stress UspA family protein